MDEFIKLVSLCKCSVEISVNDHKDYYLSVQDYINDEFEEPDIELNILQEMIRLDTVVRIQAYPNTPIGFFVVFHYDINQAVDIAIKCAASYNK
jgi:hypothetical protein